MLLHEIRHHLTHTSFNPTISRTVIETRLNDSFNSSKSDKSPIFTKENLILDFVIKKMPNNHSPPSQKGARAPEAKACSRQKTRGTKYSTKKAKKNFGKI